MSHIWVIYGSLVISQELVWTLLIWLSFNLRPLVAQRGLRTNLLDVYATFAIFWYTGNICVKALPNPLLSLATIFMSIKGITWLLNSFGSFWRPWKNFVYHWLLHKIFLVYWLIACITIFSGGIKWDQNSNVWVDILSDLSFDGFGYFLVLLDTIWLTTMTRRSTKITPKVIVLVQMLTIWTYVHCVTIVWIYCEDKRNQRSSKGQQRTEKTRKQCHGCHGLLIFVKTLFTLNDWYPSRSKLRAFTHHGNLICTSSKSLVTRL